MRMFNPFMAIDLIFRFSKYHSQMEQSLEIVREFNNVIITKRRKELASNKTVLEPNPGDFDDFNIKKKMALMDILLQSEINGEPLSDEDIRDEVNTFMFAGHDTISSAMVFLLFNVAKHENVQQKLFAEIDAVFPKHRKDEEITFGKLAELHYMDLVIKESLRMYPPVPMFGRETQEEMVVSKKMRI